MSSSFKYSFDLAEVIDRFTQLLGLSRYAIYVFDYGALVGFRLATRHPERFTAVISQNGNAYLEEIERGLESQFKHIGKILHRMQVAGIRRVG